MSNIKVSFSSDENREFSGTWVAKNPAFNRIIGSALEGSGGVINYYNLQHDRSQFVSYLKEQGSSAFKTVTEKDYSCIRATNGNHQIEIRTKLDTSNTPKAASPGKPVKVAGSIGIYLKGPTGGEEITAKNIEVTAANVSEFAGAASVIANVIQRGLTGYLSSLAEAGSAGVEAAIDTAASAASAEIESEIGLEVAIEALSIVEFLGIIAVVVAILLVLFLALVKKMTHQLTIFNSTNYDIEYKIMYLYNYNSSSPPLNIQGILPKINSADGSLMPLNDSLIPLGGGVMYNVASKATIFLQNSNSEAGGIGYVISFSCKGQQNLGFTLLGDIPSVGQNSFCITPGIGKGEAFYNEVTGGFNPFQPNRALKQLKIKEVIETISVTLANDQLSGQTNYAGYSGYNYCSLLYIDQS